MSRFAMLALFLSLATAGMAADYTSASAASEKLVAAGDAAAAVTLLQGALGDCPAGDPGRECRAQLQFALGYARESAGELEPAAAAYEAVLREYPDNAQALANLAGVYRRAGNAQNAATTYERAAKVDPAAAATYLLAGAEVLHQADDHESAIKLYRSAMRAGSPDAAPRLVTMMDRWVETAADDAERRWRLQRSSEVADQLRRDGTIGPALDAYENIMARRAAAPDIASHALAAWTETHANAQSLTAGALSRLPPVSEWQSAFLAGLAATVANGTWSFDASAFTNDLERYAAAAAAKAIGDQLVAENKPKEAQALYREALSRAPRPDEQDSSDELSWRPVVYLDAALQLARIAQATKDDRLFAQVEDQLFDQKMAAYRSKNLFAVQRMHTVLGTIYAERGEWKVKAGNPYTNATFQLEKALETAALRQEKQPSLQPLPYLRTTLAEGYRIQDDQAAARKQEIAAAKDYLDLDSIDSAQASLRRAAAAQPTPEEKQSIDALQAITNYRSVIQKGTSTADPWKSPATLKLDDDFVSRQKFKTYSDLGLRAQQLGKEKQAETYFDAAIVAVQEQKVVPKSDASRIQQLEKYTLTTKRKTVAKLPSLDTIEIKPPL